MDNLTERFRDIRSRINRLDEWDRTRFIFDLGSSEILKYQELECDYRDTGLSVVYVSAAGIAFHSSTRPAIPRGRFYCLFDVELSQAAWFLALGYTEEAKVIHQLKYG
jgi:hypothetical protein